MTVKELGTRLEVALFENYKYYHTFYSEYFPFVLLTLKLAKSTFNFNFSLSMAVVRHRSRTLWKREKKLSKTNRTTLKADKKEAIIRLGKSNIVRKNECYKDQLECIYQGV